MVERFRRNKSLQSRWQNLSTTGKGAILLCLGFAIWALEQKWADKMVWAVNDHQVIGNRAVGTSQSVAVEDDTYYLSQSFSKSSARTAGLDESLFVEPTAPKKVQPKAKVEQRKPTTPVEQYAVMALNVGGIEEDGAFINGRYYLWGEKVTDSPITTDEGRTTAKLIKRSSDGVLIAVAGKTVSLRMGQ